MPHGLLRGLLLQLPGSLLHNGSGLLRGSLLHNGSGRGRGRSRSRSRSGSRSRIGFSTFCCSKLTSEFTVFDFEFVDLFVFAFYCLVDLIVILSSYTLASSFSIMWSASRCVERVFEGGYFCVELFRGGFWFVGVRCRGRGRRGGVFALSRTPTSAVAEVVVFVGQGKRVTAYHRVAKWVSCPRR